MPPASGDSAVAAQQAVEAGPGYSCAGACAGCAVVRRLVFAGQMVARLLVERSMVARAGRRPAPARRVAVPMGRRSPVAALPPRLVRRWPRWRQQQARHRGSRRPRRIRENAANIGRTQATGREPREPMIATLSGFYLCRADVSVNPGCRVIRPRFSAGERSLLNGSTWSSVAENIPQGLKPTWILLRFRHKFESYHKTWPRNTSSRSSPSEVTRPCALGLVRYCLVLCGTVAMVEAPEDGRKRPRIRRVATSKGQAPQRWMPVSLGWPCASRRGSSWRPAWFLPRFRPGDRVRWWWREDRRRVSGGLREAPPGTELDSAAGCRCRWVGRRVK